MKKTIFIMAIILSSVRIFSQNVSINTSGAPAQASAMLDISSNAKGILIPRMTTAECAAIASPASGLLVYDTDKKTFMYYDGNVWVDVANTAIKNGWSTKGNSGTSPSTDFVGTVDNTALVLKTNNIQSGKLDHINQNYFIGQYAGTSITNGIKNVGIGQEALKNNTSGQMNTAEGHQSLGKNTTGNANSGFGQGSLYNNLTGFENTAVGNMSMNANGAGDSNTALGAYSLQLNTDGQLNTAAGHSALKSNTNGTGNTAIGAGSLFTNFTGGSNLALGNNALRANVSGYYNMASGTSALYNNTNGNNNTASGTSALHDNTTGYSNVAAGRDALYKNTIMHNLVAVGDSALRSNGLNVTGSWQARGNTAIGSKAMMSNTIGFSSTAIGFESLKNITTGERNTAVGAYSMINSTTGTKNTAVGDSTLSLNTIGYNNTAVGTNALNKNTSGNYNNAFGMASLQSNTVGWYNVGIGDFALRDNFNGVDNTAVGDYALAYTTFGNFNTGIGEGTLTNNTTGDYNVAIGYNANVTSADLTHATAIGAEAYTTCSYCMVLGGTGSSSSFVGINTNSPNADFHIKQKSDANGNLSRGIKLQRNTGIGTFWRTYVDGLNLLTFEYDDLGDGNLTYMTTSGDFVSGSDIRIKKDITPLTGSLEKIKLLSPKSYHYLHQESTDPVHVGLIAQELETVFPDMVYTRENGTKGIAYQQLAPVAIEAIKEQQVIIEDLQRQINELKALVQKD